MATRAIMPIMPRSRNCVTKYQARFGCRWSYRLPPITRDILRHGQAGARRSLGANLISDNLFRSTDFDTAAESSVSLLVIYLRQLLCSSFPKKKGSRSL